MKTPLDHWHYPRPALAHAYLQLFDLGLSSARGIFAKRRMGKTEFLKKDLLPAAEVAGYLTAYANLWESRENPSLALLEAIGLAIAPKGLDKVLEHLRRPVKKVKASGKVAGLGEGSIEAELADEKAVASTTLLALFRKFDATGKKLLLVIDEAQVLANAEHSNFTHALRAALDTRKTTIKVVFAGSSENTLRQMFGRASEPFYNWAPLEPFELLGRDFVEDMVKKVNIITKFPLKMEDALAAFDALNRTPEFFRQYLSQYLLYAQFGPDEALKITKAKVFNDDNFVKLWQELTVVEQVMLKLVVSGGVPVYGKDARTRASEALGLKKPVTAYTLQNAMRKLEKAAILTRLGDGDYRFEDDAFAEWVKKSAH